MSPNLKEKLRESLTFIRSKTNKSPRIGIILGSGMGSFVEKLEDTTAIEGRDIPHYPVPTVEGHAGRLIFGEIEGIDVAAVQGRAHLYEGYSMAEIAYSVHLLAEVGVKSLIVTNAAGGVNPNFAPGDLMIICDHINFAFDNPLRGPHDPDLGARFPDMAEPYCREYIDLAERTALDLGIRTQKGVLFFTKGPSYETAAEVRMIRILGGDAVTMSTVPEVIVAAQKGLKVLGISCITNMATGITAEKLCHRHIIEVGRQAMRKFAPLVRGSIKALSLFP